MSSTVLAVEGMFHGAEALAIERVLDDALVDGDGRILVPIIDVLAILRIDVAAELLVDRCPTGCDTAWIVRLWPQLSDTSAPVTSLRATSFASFVGLT